MEIIKIIISIVIVWGIWKFSTTEMYSVEIEIQKIYMWLEAEQIQHRMKLKTWRRWKKEEQEKRDSELNSICEISLEVPRVVIRPVEM